MTRRQIFRLMLALLLLRDGSATSYWYALPKKAKRYRLWDAKYSAREFDAVVTRVGQRAIEQLFARRLFRVGARMSYMETTPIGEREFRLPFRRKTA